MNTQPNTASSMLLPTALAGVLGAAVLAFAVLAGPADADTFQPGAHQIVHVQR